MDIFKRITGQTQELRAKIDHLELSVAKELIQLQQKRATTMDADEQGAKKMGKKKSQTKEKVVEEDTQREDAEDEKSEPDDMQPPEGTPQMEDIEEHVQDVENVNAVGMPTFSSQRKKHVAHRPPRNNPRLTPKRKAVSEEAERGDKPSPKMQRTEVKFPVRRSMREKTAAVKSPFVATYAKRGKCSPQQQIYMHMT